jgi:hypothetical protein
VAEHLSDGTKEYLIYDLTDRIGDLTDLTGTNPRFDIWDPTDSKVVADSPLEIDPLAPMRVFALIDTTLPALAANDSDVYHVYLRFDTGPESPYLHGGDFYVDSTPK